MKAKIKCTVFKWKNNEKMHVKLEKMHGIQIALSLKLTLSVPVLLSLSVPVLSFSFSGTHFLFSGLFSLFLGFFFLLFFGEHERPQVTRAPHSLSLPSKFWYV